MPMSAQHPELSERLKQETDNPLLQRFANLLFEKANPDFLEAFDAGSLVKMAAGALDFFSSSSGRTPRVQVFNPDPAKDGWESPYTVVRVELSDRPFIVDSIKAEIRRQDYELYYLLHPVYGVSRGPDGQLDSIERPGAPLMTENQAFELFFIEKETDQERLDRLKEGLEKVLRDVVRATDAYEALQQRVVGVAAMLRERAGHNFEQAEELLEYASFLEWLDDDNFVFLGYREYDIKEIGGEDHLALTAGSGLGIK